MWDIEPIPGEDFVYYRVHKMYFRNGELIPGVFREIKDGMSSDWEKYSTPQMSRKSAKKPEDNGIVKFITGDLRNINLKVLHAPSKNNRAHTNIKGVDVEIRLKLLNIFQWEITIAQVI